MSLGGTATLGLTLGVQETGKLDNGTGLAPFVYSGVESVTLTLSGVPNSALEYGYILVNAGPGLTGDTRVNLGSTLDLGVKVDDVTIGFTGDGIGRGSCRETEYGSALDNAHDNKFGSNVQRCHSHC